MSRAAALRIRDYLVHILDAVERINRYVSASEDEFLRDEKTQDA